MNNKTKSKIIISMNHIDHANKIIKFLKVAQELSSQGGDLELCAKSKNFYVGHDVKIEKVQHVIFQD